MEADRRSPFAHPRGGRSAFVCGLDIGVDRCILPGMDINITDQRKGQVPVLHIDQELVEAYCGIAGIDLSAPGTLKIRIRDGHGPYGTTRPVSGGYRVVINVRYSKLALSEGASYVVSNTLLHELRHVAQGQEKGWGALSHDYHGWSETEAREYGRKIKGQPELLAVR